MTKVTQQKALGEGLALGAIMAGISAIEGNKGNLELDFRAAWRRWPFADRFPSIKAGPAQDDIFVQVISSSANRRGPVALWRGPWPYSPELVHDWEPDEVADVIDEAIPAAAWRDLAETWLTGRRPADSARRGES